MLKTLCRGRLWPGWIGAAMILIFHGVPSSHAAGSCVNLSWNANTEPDLAGYIAYWGMSSRDYSFSERVGNKTSHRVCGLQEGITYFFAVTAIDFSENESDFSNEVSLTVAEGSSCDVNGDGAVNVLDLQLEVNVVLGSATAPDDVQRADVNGDGSTDILDIQTVVGCVLAGE